MRDLEKVNISQFKSFWTNLLISMFVLVGIMILSRLLPHYYTPIIGLITAALLYMMVYNNKINQFRTCMIVPYAMFYCLVYFSFITIILNMLDIWNILRIPRELSFFNDPYVPALLLDPVCLVILVIFRVRLNYLSICIDCKITTGLSIERGKLGEIFSYETRHHLNNLILLFAILSLAVWAHYWMGYYRRNELSNRDWYVFFWINVILFSVDIIYFAVRYFNIYIDLKDHDEIITEEEIDGMSTKTYLRFYMVCGNRVFLTWRATDEDDDHEKLDTPFLLKYNATGVEQVKHIIEQQSGIYGGKLKFFFARKSMDLAKHHLYRYFYFVDEDLVASSEIANCGEWMELKEISRIFKEDPLQISHTMLTDLTRMATIIITQKLFDENGHRKINIKSYHPTISMEDVRDGDYDFQDDKWMKIALYNSDSFFFSFNMMMRKILT